MPQHTPVSLVLSALLALAPLPLSAQSVLAAEPVPSPRPATSHTVQAQQLVHKTLPFQDKEDFADAQRGFMAAEERVTITNANGRVVWDLEKYKSFLQNKEQAPDTVNPSLWRNARLCLINGLFKVTDRIYQVRGYDLSNITFIQGDTGWIVFDPLISQETARAALELLHKHVLARPVVAVVYSHSHVDHYGGVRGVVDEADVRSGKVQILAPEHFAEHAVSENLIAGPAMSRRAVYMYGARLPRNVQGSVGGGLGMTTSTGSVGFIPPTREVKRTGEEIVVDGVRMVFQMTPGTEAPAEMNTWFPQFSALWMAENSCSTMHNILTLRGAQVRDAQKWAAYLQESLETWGAQATVKFQAHHWPRWGSTRIVRDLAQQRDMYKYMHDQSVRLMNMGYTGEEIAELMQLPDALGKVWGNRDYYGTLRHNTRAIYQRYMGWYDGNPANLNNLPPEEVAPRYVEFMGGADEVLRKGTISFEKGDYRWVAEVMKHVVFAQPNNAAAKGLLADALEQMGYQAESGAWRAAYLQGAWELRHGLPTVSAANSSSPDILKSMTPAMIFDYLSVHLNAGKVEGKRYGINITLTDMQEKHGLWVENSVLHAVPRPVTRADFMATSAAGGADVTITTDKNTLTALCMGLLPLDKAVASGKLRVEGKTAVLQDFLASLEASPKMFPIVTP